MNEGAGPLSADQRAAVRDARDRLRLILRSASVATVTAWSVGVFGALSILWGLLAGLPGVIVGAALLGVAWNEGRSRDRLRALDPEGARMLGRNQLLLAGVVVVYAGWAVARAWLAPDPSTRQLEELAGLDANLVAELTTLVYGIVVVIVVVVQGLLARFHFARVEMLEAFRATTPAWVLELLSDSRGMRRAPP